MKPQRSMPKAARALGALCLLGACSGPSSSGFPSTFTSDHGKLSVHLSTAPEEPPYAGNDSVELILTDPKTGKPIEDEQISLVPFMPAMGHGTDVIPKLQAMGKGRYVFTNVNLYMPGEWQLRFQFSGPVNDSAAPDLLDVQ